MSYSVSALNNWFNEADNKLGFIQKALLGGDTAKVAKKVAGVKYKLPLNGLYTTSTFVAESCDDSASGTTTFTQRVLEVKPLKDVELICANDLRTKWVNALMSSGSPDTEPAEIANLIMQEKARAHQAALETAYWQETSLFSGWLKILGDLGFGGAGDPVEANPTTGGGWTQIASGTGIVASNVMTIMDQMYKVIPSAVKSQYKDSLICWCGYDVFTTYSLKLRDLNLFHYKTVDGIDTLYHPGTNMMIQPVGGLNGTSKLVSTWKDNLIIGCDVDSEETNVRWIEINDKDYEGVKVKTNIKVGVEIAKTDECAFFVLA